MKSSWVLRSMGCGVAAMAALLLSWTAAGAQDENAPKLVSVLGAFPFDAMENVWVQRTVRLSNPTDQAANLSVAYVVATEGGAKAEYVRLAALPPKTERLAMVAARPEKLAPVGGKVKSFDRSYEDYTLANAATGQVLSSQRIAQVAKLPPDITTLCVLRTPLPESYDSDQYLGSLPTRFWGATERLASILQQLPDRWYGYSIARIVVVAELDLRQLRPSQIEALLDWAARGGLLVIAASPLAPEILSGPLGRVAGVAAVGVHAVAALHMETAPGQIAEIPLEQPMAMVELCVDDATVVLRSDGLPLLTQRPYGDGHVAALAVPLGALRDYEKHPALQEVLAALGKLRQTRSGLDSDAFPAPAVETLNRIAGRRGPGELLPFLILAGLAALTFAGGAVLRLRRRGELLWVVLIPLSLLLAGAMYLHGALQADPERLSSIALVCGEQDGQARVQQVFAYYSGPQGRELTFSTDAQRGWIRRLGSGGGMAAVQRTITGRSLRLPDESVRDNVTLAMLADATVPLRGVEGSATFDAAGLVGTLVNRAADDLSDAVVLVNGRTYRLGNLPAGKPTEIRLGAGEELGEGEFTGSLIHVQVDALRNTLLGSLEAKPSLKRRVEHRPLVIGYGPVGPIDPLGGRDLPRQGWSVVSWPLTLAAPAPGTKVRIPAGFVVRGIEGAAWSADTQQFREQLQEAELLVRASLPAGLHLRGATAYLRIALTVGDSVLTVCGLAESADGQQTAATLREIRNPKGEIEPIAVADADRFRSRSDGAYVFSLKVTPTASGGGIDFGPSLGPNVDPRIAKAMREEQPAGGGSTRWKFLRVDVALEGVSQ